MTPAIKSLLIHLALFISIVTALYLLLDPKNPRHSSSTESRPLSDDGISIVIGATHTTVTVDDRSDRVPRGEEENSEIFQEALERMAVAPTFDEPKSFPRLRLFRPERIFFLLVFLVFTVLFFSWWHRHALFDGRSPQR